MEIYLSSSWKNRRRVRILAQKLEANGFDVYDFTNPACRTSPEIPPERFPEQFDPEKHMYGDYLRSVPEWEVAVNANKDALDRCDLVVLMLPCGLDAHADAYYALGLGKRLVVCGQPRAGERAPVHLWSEKILNSDDDAVDYLVSDREERVKRLRVWVDKIKAVEGVRKLLGELDSASGSLEAYDVLGRIVHIVRQSRAHSIEKIVQQYLDVSASPWRIVLVDSISALGLDLHYTPLRNSILTLLHSNDRDLACSAACALVAGGKQARNSLVLALEEYPPLPHGESISRLLGISIECPHRGLLSQHDGEKKIPRNDC